MRYYLRMREIELLQYERAPDEDAKASSSPRIDSSWSHAQGVYSGKQKWEYRPVPIHGPRQAYRFAWFFPHVFMPHLVSVIAGLVLLFFGRHGTLGEMKW